MKRIGVINGYVDTALWLAHDEDGNAKDLSEHYGFEDLEKRVQHEIEADVDAFLDWLVERFAEPPSLSMGEWSVGSNLFLTAARHGAGFWDCGLDDWYHRDYDNVAHEYEPWEYRILGPTGGHIAHNDARLGQILTDMAHTFKPPTIWIEHDGKWWMA